MNHGGANGLQHFVPLDARGLQALFGPIAGEATEVAGFAYLDRGGALLGMRTMRSDARDTIAVPIRIVAADVLAFDAAGVVMAHNHPGGDARPSAADRALTKRLAICLDAIGTRLLDHVVLTASAATSFRALGLL